MRHTLSPSQERWYPVIIDEEGELDTVEVDLSTRNSWLAIYSLQSDFNRLVEMIAEIGDPSLREVKQSKVDNVTSFTAGNILLDNLAVQNPSKNRVPYLNGSLLLDALNAPIFDPSIGALSITGNFTAGGNLDITGTSRLEGDVSMEGELSVTGAVAFADTFEVTGAVDFLSTLDVVGAVTLLSTLGVTGLITSDGGIVIDADLAEAFLVRADGDSGDVFAVNTLTGVVTVTGDQTISGTLLVVGDVTIDDGNAELLSDNLGNDISGKLVTVGRNENVGPEGGAPGVIELVSADGTSCFIWCKNDGGLTIGTAQPTGSTGSPTVPSEIGGVVVTTPSIKSYSFISPPGAPGVFFVSGFYDFDTSEAALDQGPPPGNLSVTHGNSNAPYGAHASLVAGGAGTASGGAGTVEIEVSGTSVTDAGVRTVSDTEVIVADVTAMVLDQYFETVKKWIGQITFTIQNSGGSTHTTFSANFNFGFARYEDFGGNNFNVDIFDFVGLPGANDSVFNIELLHHNDQGWTFAAAGFVPGGTVLVDFAATYSTESDLDNTVPFSFQRVDIDTLIEVVNKEGLIIRITTGSTNSIKDLNLHVSGLFT